MPQTFQLEALGRKKLRFGWAYISGGWGPYAKMAAVNFCHREELFVNRNILLHCKDLVKRNHCMKF